MFGVVFARLYESASDACPIAYASAATRTRPVTRESSVPSATVELERTSRAADDGDGSTAAVLTSRAVARRARRVRRKWFPHHSARNTSAPIVNAAPAPLNAADAIVTRVGGPMRRLPSAEVSVTVIVNVPDARASTANCSVLVPGGSTSTWSEPFGKRSFSLASCTRTVTGVAVWFTKLSGTFALRAVSVTRRPVVDTLRCNSSAAVVTTARSSSACAVEFSVLSARSSACSPRSTSGSSGPRALRSPASSLWTRL